jgi:hypothetical protein
LSPLACSASSRVTERTVWAKVQTWPSRSHARVDLEGVETRALVNLLVKAIEADRDLPSLRVGA